MTHGALSPDASVMSMNHARHGCETDAGALKILVAVESVEGGKEPVGVVHVKARAIVANEKPRSGAGSQPNSITGCGDLGAELDRVAEQVFQRDLKKARVGVGAEAWFDGKRLSLDRYARREDCRRPPLGTKLADVEVLPYEISAGDARELQKGVDQLTHPLHAGADAMNVGRGPWHRRPWHSLPRARG